jgi:hypothetical protein
MYGYIATEYESSPDTGVSRTGALDSPPPTSDAAEPAVSAVCGSADLGGSLDA